MPRRPLDQYVTPPHYVKALVPALLPGLKAGMTILEPCVGNGDIIKAMPRGLTWKTNDLDKACRADSHGDAANPASKMWGSLGFDWCITNPPFSQETEILWNALQWCKRVAFLARLSFLEPTQKHAELYARWGTPTSVVVLPRYSFRNNDDGKRQTDSMTCCWLIWTDYWPVGKPWLTISR